MNIKAFYRLIGLAIFLILLTTGRVFSDKVVGYYYTGVINGNLPIQMSLSWNSAEINGEYQYVATGHYLDLDGPASSTSPVALREYNHDDYTVSSGSFTGAFAENRRLFTGVWRSSDGKRSLPFSLLAVAEYRCLTKTIKLDADDQVERKEEGKTPDRIVTEVFPYFYESTPSLSFLNRQIRNDVIADIMASNKKDPEGVLPNLGTNCRIDYIDDNLVSLTYITTNEGGAHNLYGIDSENYLIDGPKPKRLEWDDLLSSDKRLRAELMSKIRAKALKLARAFRDHCFDADVKWKDLGFSLNAKRVTFYYPCEIGSLGSYDVQMSYADLVPYLAKKCSIPQRLFPCSKR
jgi:hypothetical protein